MRYGDVCSGIGAAAVAWKDLGWECAYHSEIEPFARKVLATRHPDTPVHGDFTTIGDNEYGAVKLIVGGTPCQDFALSGWRRGMDGHSGNLSLDYVSFLERIQPNWFVWENVTGVLSCNKGADFRSLTTAMEELGYGLCWRTLDAQNFGVPQQRKRVFIVGYRGDWRPAAAVLFDGRCFERDSGKGKASRTSDAREVGASDLQAYFRIRGFGDYIESPIAATLTARAFKRATDLILTKDNRIRKLTPLECERLMGFPDNYTAIRWRGKDSHHCPMEPRIRVLGNSMAVPVMTWIGERIKHVELLLSA